jgi:hypothetical protein
MSLPGLLRESEATDAAWRRRVRDLLNMTVRRTLDQGDTGSRPANPEVGTQFYDKTLAQPIWWDGSAWRDAMGGPA